MLFRINILQMQECIIAIFLCNNQQQFIDRISEVDGKKISY